MIKMLDRELITWFMEQYVIDEILTLLFFIYFFRLANLAVIFLGNAGEALMQIYHAFKGED